MPLASLMPDTSAVRVCPTSNVPRMTGFPVGSTLGSFTTFIAGLVTDSSVPRSSVKVTRTFRVLPSSAVVTV